MRKKIAILCDFDIAKRPRPFRAAQMLKESYEVFGIARECSFIEGIKCFAFPAPKTSKERTQEENQRIFSYCKNKEFDKLIYLPTREPIAEILKSLPSLEGIIVEDIALLPFALDYKKTHRNVKILIDLREYYPLEYQNDPLWMESFGQFFKYLCEQYLPQVDKAISVSEGIAQKYQEEFGIVCEVLYSLPDYFALDPLKSSEKIKVIYHGFLSPDRDSKNLLEIAKFLDDRFVLHIMGLSNQKNFLEDLIQSAKNLKNIRFLPPVAMNDIIPFCNQFDMGIIPFPPNGFNNTFALPNKFFEYIQSRLCVVSTPLPEIKSLIQKFQIGKVSKDFEVKSIAQTLNEMSLDSINAYKNATNKVAKKMSLISNQPRFIKIINDTLTSK